MPAQKSAKPVKSPTKPAAQAEKKAPVETKKSAAKPAAKPAAKTATPPATKAKTVPASKSPAAEELKTAAEAVEPAKKIPGRPPKAAAAGAPAAKTTTGAKRGRKPKAAAGEDGGDDADLSDIEADLEGEPEVAAAATTSGSVKTTWKYSTGMRSAWRLSSHCARTRDWHFGQCRFLQLLNAMRR